MAIYYTKLYGEDGLSDKEGRKLEAHECMDTM